MKYNKEVSGGQTVYQPDDLHEYALDAWDIRISIGDSPLDEAFYMTVQDTSSAMFSVERALKNYATNPSRASQLDVAEYPELPFLQQELIQYHKNAKAGLLELDYYINKSPDDEPLDLSKSVESVMSVCTYDDGSNDYRLLDLVIETREPIVTEELSEAARKTHGPEFLLRVIGHFDAGTGQEWTEFCQSPPIQTAMETNAAGQATPLNDALTTLRRQQYIEFSPEDARLSLSPGGRNQIATWDTQTREAQQQYEPFRSVSISPAGLDVPGGFDVRIQMMELDDVETERQLLRETWLDRSDEIFTTDNWLFMFETFAMLEPVLERLSYRTNFSLETLNQLRALASS
jgi:hypothetical protein